MRSLCRVVAVLLISSSPLLAQAPPAIRSLVNFPMVPHPPVPADPLELAAAAAQPVQSAQQRIDAVSMLSKARELSDVRAHPYDLTTSFVGSGGLASDGNWMLEDMASGKAYRWTAQGPNYSAVNLYPNSVANGLYGNVPGGAMPLRLAQVRAAMFFTYSNIGPGAPVRTATGFLDGAEQHCLLIRTGPGNPSSSGGRNWDEAEYCVDAKSGLLTTYSLAPGLFVHYDYSGGLQFHGKMTDLEILASTDPSMNQAALEHAALLGSRPPGQPGATEQSQEQIFTIEFLTPNP